jgi:tellurite resistance protein TehA-like permease
MCRFSRHKHTPESVASSWLLPIVTSVVAAASGGVVANALLPYSTSLARSTIVVSYVVWGTGVPPAMFVITLWIHRSTIHGLPSPSSLPSVFLPLGPCGQGSYGILLLGKVVRNLAYEHDLSFSVMTGQSARNIADAIYAGGLITGLILWGLGLMWYILASAFFFEHCIRNRSYIGAKSFSIAFTALTFPIGVFATATSELAAELDSSAFKVIGAFISVQVVLNWLYVFLMTCWKAFDGTVFVAPEVADFEGGRPPARWSSRKSSADRV